MHFEQYKTKNNLINLIFLISLMLTTLNLSVNAQDKVDPIYESLNEGLNIYQESGDVDRLIAIGLSLPEGIYVTNPSRTGHIDYDLIRPLRTELYLRWISEFLELGKRLDYSPINYDSNDPRFLCARTGSAIVIDPTPEYLEREEFYKRNCRIRYYHSRYLDTMEYFGCFYKRAYLKQGKKLVDLQLIAENWCERNIDDPVMKIDIMTIIRSELGSNRCSRL